MQLPPGVTLKRLRVQEHESPAFVFIESRVKQFVAVILSLCILVAGVCFLVKPQALPVDFARESPFLGRLATSVVIVFFGAAGFMKLQSLRTGDGFLALLPEGLYRVGLPRTYFIPWDCIEEIDHFYMNATPFLGVGMRDPKMFEDSSPLSEAMMSNRKWCGWDLAFGVRALKVSPSLLITAFQYYHLHPEAGSEIGTIEGIAHIQQLVAQKWKPSLENRESESKTSENREELMNEELQQVISALAAANSTSNRRAVYQELLKTTFYLPSSGSEGDITQLIRSQNEAGKLVLAAFSDPSALQRWTTEARSLLVMPAEKLFEIALENNFEEIRINPAGPAGGTLTRSEFALLAQGELPD